MRYPIILVLGGFIWGTTQLSAQLKIEGLYQGEDLLVQNPFDSEGIGFCTNSVRVNKAKVKDINIDASVYEIPLTKLGLSHGDPITIKIDHKKGCHPKVINVEVINIETKKK